VGGTGRGARALPARQAETRSRAGRRDGCPLESALRPIPADLCVQCAALDRPSDLLLFPVGSSVSATRAAGPASRGQGSAEDGADGRGGHGRLSLCGRDSQSQCAAHISVPVRERRCHPSLTVPLLLLCCSPLRSISLLFSLAFPSACLPHADLAIPRRQR
jgi:hypothetical protein